MRSPRFGDRVRIAVTPETEARGIAGRVGEFWSESRPDVEDVGPVIGDRGADNAVSVVFADTPDVIWFAPHLVEPVGRLGRPPGRALFVFLAALALVAATAIAQVGQTRVLRFTLVSAGTPCFPVRDYLTSGSYPNIRAGSARATEANIALRRAVVADQSRYASAAARHLTARGGGLYETGIDPGLTSASTVVVSTLIPALELYPGGTGGQMWISATVDVRAGRTVSLRELLANPSLALPVLVREWKARLRHTVLWREVAEDRAGYTPSFEHYRHFALTPTGLAFGSRQENAGSRFAAVVPYSLVRPYLSPLGRRLVAGVRPPRTPRHTSPPTGWLPTTCTTQGRST